MTKNRNHRARRILAKHSMHSLTSMELCMSIEVGDGFVIHAHSVLGYRPEKKRLNVWAFCSAAMKMSRYFGPLEKRCEDFNSHQFGHGYCL